MVKINSNKEIYCITTENQHVSGEVTFTSNALQYFIACKLLAALDKSFC